jgi:hypothetical protein
MRAQVDVERAARAELDTNAQMRPLAVADERHHVSVRRQLAHQRDLFAKLRHCRVVLVADEHFDGDLAAAQLAAVDFGERALAELLAEPQSR